MLLVLWLSAVLALAGSIHLIVHERLRPRISSHRVAFSSALFWLWYLAPGSGEQSALASVLSLLAP